MIEFKSERNLKHPSKEFWIYIGPSNFAGFTDDVVKKYLNQIVSIDGTARHVVNVEAYRGMHYSIGQDIALWVKYQSPKDPIDVSILKPGAGVWWQRGADPSDAEIVMVVQYHEGASTAQCWSFMAHSLVYCPVPELQPAGIGNSHFHAESAEWGSIKLTYTELFARARKLLFSYFPDEWAPRDTGKDS